MIILRKTWTTSNVNSPNFRKQDMTEHYRYFGFYRMMHPERVAEFISLVPEHQMMMADLLAAMIATLFHSELLKRDNIIVEGLKCCRDICIDRDYEESDLTEIVSDASTSQLPNVVLVPGCQTEDLLNSRVRAAEKLCYELAQARCTVNIVFSGNNPQKGTSVKIKNESRRMKDYFWSLWEKRKGMDLRKKILIDLIAEEKSTKSDQNIEKFLECKKEILANKLSNVYIVSSNFHLNRLSLSLEEKLANDPSLYIKQIILIGSENVDSPSIASSYDIYIKTMIFEIYRYFLKLNEFQQMIHEHFK